MVNPICTGYNDSAGLDISNTLVTKEYLLENYQDLLPQDKIPNLRTWGANINIFVSGGGTNCYASGQLGDGTISNRSTPVQTVAGSTNWKQISAGRIHTTAIKTNGTLWTWGCNGDGQLGDVTTLDRSSPIQTISGGTNWKQVSGGGFHTAAIKTDGTLWLWGANGAGQLGDGTTSPKSSPVQTISGGTNWSQVATGNRHTAAIKTDGTLWLWGSNCTGQLGDNTGSSKCSPVQTIAGGNNWKQVDASIEDNGNVSCPLTYTWNFTAAVKTDGTLWTWGNNFSGQLGDGTTIKRSSPVQTIAGGTNWKQVSLGMCHAAAIKTDGSLWSWGENCCGQLGNNTIASRSSPVQTIAGGTNWKQVSAGGYFSSAIKTDGTLWIWGNNRSGELGDNTIVNKSSPIQISPAIYSWKQVSNGLRHATAIISFGEF